MAVVDEQGEIALVKNIPSGKVDTRVGAAGEIKKNLATRLPNASAGQSRLFDQIFGAAFTTTSATPKAPIAPRSNVLASGNLEVLDAPSHTLPPARLLWKSMLGSFAVSAPVGRVEPEEKVDTVMVNGDSKKVEEGARAVVVESNPLLEEILRKKLSI